MTRTFLSLAVALLAAAPARAAGGGLDYAAPVAPAPPDVGALVLRLFLITSALAGLCAAVVWFARRANRPAGVVGGGGGGGRMRHDGTLALDRMCAVHLLSVDGQTVAVTTDATGLRSMVVLSEPFEAALDGAQELEPEFEPAPPQPVAATAPGWSPDDVRHLLQRLVSRPDKAAAAVSG